MIPPESERHLFGLDVSHHYAEVNGVRLHYATGGVRGGESLVLRGSPQSWMAGGAGIGPMAVAAARFAAP